MDFYEIIIESMTPCGGKAHSTVRIVEEELENPMDFVKRETDGGELTETVSPDGSVIIEVAQGGYIKRFTFSKA